MHETLDFEVALERRLRARAGVASRPFDASSIAAAAIATRAVRRPIAVVWPRRWGLFLAVGGLVLAMVAGAAVAAALLAREPRIAVARPDGIYLLAADRSVVRRIADTGDLPRLSWSSDGELLLVTDLFHEGGPRLTVYRTDGTIAWEEPWEEQSASGTAFSGSVYAASWSHRGHQIAWIGDRRWRTPRGSFLRSSGLHVTDLDSGETRHEYKAGVAWGETAAWSPDDTRILAFSGNVGSEGSLLVVPVDGDDPVSLGTPTGDPMRAGYQLMGPRWSPDGRYIAVAAMPTGDANEPRLVVVETSTGRLVGQASDGSPWFAWSPDGESIAYGQISAPPDLSQRVVVARLPLGSGDTSFAFPDDGRTDAFGRDGGWMPDGRLWAMRARGSSWDTFDLWAANADGTNAELVLRDVTAAAFRP